jgi:hypothetical protein
MTRSPSTLALWLLGRLDHAGFSINTERIKLTGPGFRQRSTRCGHTVIIKHLTKSLARQDERYRWIHTEEVKN